MIGSRIKYFRKKLNLTQEELCKGICSTTYLSKVENNKMDPSEEIILLLTKKMSISADVLANINDKMLEEKLNKWYEEMKAITDKYVLGHKYEEIKVSFQHIEDPSLRLKYKLFEMKYFLATENFHSIPRFIEEIDKYKSLFTHELLFYYHYFIGTTYFHLNNINDAKLQLESALAQIELLPKYLDNFQYELADLYYYLSLCHEKLFQTHKTRDYALKSFAIADKMFDYHRQIKLNIILGNNESRINNFPAALEYYERTRRSVEITKQYNYLGIIYYNMGNLYKLQEKSSEAIQYYLLSLQFTPSENYQTLISTYYCLALEYKKSNQINEMEKMINRGNNLLEKHPLKEYHYHFRLLELFHNDALYHSRQFIKKEVIPYFKQIGQWNYVVYYTEMLAVLYEKHFHYKDACRLYQNAIHAQKLMQ